MDNNYKKIVDKVAELVRKSAILSSRGWDVKDIDKELFKLYEINTKAYADGYEKAKKSFGY